MRVNPNPRRQRPCWEVSPEAWAAESDWVEVPLMGQISAGLPIVLATDRETLRVPRGWVRKHSYALRVKGRSMIDDQIQDGDLILVEHRETAENGQSVVALIQGERVTLKRFYVDAEGVRLQPANPEMAPIWLRHDEIRILGIVSAVIRHRPTAH